MFKRENFDKESVEYSLKMIQLVSLVLLLHYFSGKSKCYYNMDIHPFNTYELTLRLATLINMFAKNPYIHVYIYICMKEFHFVQRENFDKESVEHSFKMIQLVSLVLLLHYFSGILQHNTCSYSQR